MRNSYACKVLREKWYQIFAGGKRILNQPYTKTHKKLITKLENGKETNMDLWENSAYVNIIDMEELYSLKFKIIKYKPDVTFWKNQRIALKIVKINYPSKEENEVDKLPSGHYIRKDLINQRIQGVGRNFSPTGRSAWVSLYGMSIAPERDYSRNIMNVRSSLKSFKTRFTNKYNLATGRIFFEIHDKVIGITEDGLICCVPKPKTTDMHVAIICGSKGTGKSMLENSLECGYFNKDKIQCININDINPETQTRCLEWEQGDFRKDLQRFGEPTLPEPAVYLHPTTKEEYTMIHYLEVGYKVSLSYRQLLQDNNLMTYNPEWKMDESKSGLRWKSLISHKGKLRPDGLVFKQTLEEAEHYVDIKIKDEGMKNKIITILNDIYDNKITDISSGVPSKWVLKKSEKQEAMSAWTACMKAGLFPFINTSGIREYIWYPLWLRNLIADVIKYAKREKYPVMIFTDEIADIMRNKATREILEKTVRELRKAGIGLTIVSHLYSDVPSGINQHFDYLYVFNTNEDELLRTLKKYRFTKRQLAEIPNLKKFECYAVGDFVLYDLNGNKISNEGKPVKIIRIKPPNCQHFGGK